MIELQNEIIRLKSETETFLLVHNYVPSEIQEVADFCGDSLELSIRAKNANAKRILCCGVRFMAETAKILSPDSTVMIPAPDAGCPMADTANPVQIRKYKAEHPGTFFVAYVNTTAATKAEVDCCCTSGNVDRVLASIPRETKVMFLPDRNLGANMNKAQSRAMSLWDGCCPIHDAVTPDMILRARELHPRALVLVHPECRPDVVSLADKALSTGAMLKFAATSDAKEFIIGTESGIVPRLFNENPGKKFYPLEPELICTDMKKITLENVKSALLGNAEEIILDRELMDRARRPIERMLAIR